MSPKKILLFFRWKCLINITILNATAALNSMLASQSRSWIMQFKKQTARRDEKTSLLTFFGKKNEKELNKERSRPWKWLRRTRDGSESAKMQGSKGAEKCDETATERECESARLRSQPMTVRKNIPSHKTWQLLRKTTHSGQGSEKIEEKTRTSAG